jgi:hypothetical protein
MLNLLNDFSTFEILKLRSLELVRRDNYLAGLDARNCDP